MHFVFCSVLGMYACVMCSYPVPMCTPVCFINLSSGPAPRLSAFRNPMPSAFPDSRPRAILKYTTQRHGPAPLPNSRSSVLFQIDGPEPRSRAHATLHGTVPTLYHTTPIQGQTAPRTTNAFAVSSSSNTNFSPRCMLSWKHQGQDNSSRQRRKRRLRRSARYMHMMNNARMQRENQLVK